MKVFHGRAEGQDVGAARRDVHGHGVGRPVMPTTDERDDRNTVFFAPGATHVLARARAGTGACR